MSAWAPFSLSLDIHDTVQTNLNSSSYKHPVVSMQIYAHHSCLAYYTHNTGEHTQGVTADIHTHHAVSFTHISAASVACVPVLLIWGYMVLYSRVTARCCFFSAEALRERLDECPLPGWRDAGTVLLLLLLFSDSSRSPLSPLVEGERPRGGGDVSSLHEPVLSEHGLWASTFCFFHVSSGWDWGDEGESGECDSVALLCVLRSKLLRSWADSSRQSSLAKEADLFMRDGGVSPAWRMRASSSVALCHSVGSNKLLCSCLSRSCCPTFRAGGLSSKLTPL